MNPVQARTQRWHVNVEYPSLLACSGVNPLDHLLQASFDIVLTSFYEHVTMSADGLQSAKGVLTKRSSATCYLLPDSWTRILPVTKDHHPLYSTLYDRWCATPVHFLTNAEGVHFLRFAEVVRNTAVLLSPAAKLRWFQKYELT